MGIGLLDVFSLRWWTHYRNWYPLFLVAASCKGPLRPHMGIFRILSLVFSGIYKFLAPLVARPCTWCVSLSDFFTAVLTFPSPEFFILLSTVPTLCSFLLGTSLQSNWLGSCIFAIMSKSFPISLSLSWIVICKYVISLFRDSIMLTKSLCSPIRSLFNASLLSLISRLRSLRSFRATFSALSCFIRFISNPYTSKMGLTSF